MRTLVVKGNLCFSRSMDELVCMEHSYIVVEDGRVAGVFRTLPERYAQLPVLDYGEQLILPGMTDLHVHAPQFAFRGLGMDMELLEWLNTYTFPEESKYKELEYADRAYGSFVNHLLHSTTTRAAIFATIHVPATELLMQKLDEAGLILAVFDGSERPPREDLELAQRCAGRPAIALVNKADKPTRFDAELIAPYFAMVLPVCCQEEGARKVIAAAVARLLGTNQIDPHAASLSGQRQLSAATRARDAVAGALDAAQGLGLDAVSVCVDDALDALCELTGENASEAVINEVFEKFCVGK